MAEVCVLFPPSSWENGFWGTEKFFFFHAFWDSFLDKVFVRMDAVNGLLEFKHFLFP